MQSLKPNGQKEQNWAEFDCLFITVFLNIGKLTVLIITLRKLLNAEKSKKCPR